MSDKNKKAKIFEFIVYGIFGLMALWGFIYIIFGIACNFIYVVNNVKGCDIYLRQKSGGLGFLTQGIIILLVAVTVLVICLLITAKRSDRDYEKEQRKAARIAQRFSTSTVVDAEISETPSDK